MRPLWITNVCPACGIEFMLRRTFVISCFKADRYFVCPNGHTQKATKEPS